MAAPSSYVKTAAMGAITLNDGTGTPVTLAIPYTRGDLTIGPLGPKLNEIAKIEARGKFISHAYAARTYPAISFSAWLPNVAGSSTAAPGTLAEFVAGLNAYAANIPTTGVGRPNTFGCTLAIEGTNFGDTSDETIKANDIFGTITITEAMDGNFLSFSGEVLGSVIVTNSTGVITYAQIS